MRAVWRECLILAGAALLFALLALIGGERRADPRPLLATTPTSVQLTSADSRSAVLDLASDPPLLRDAEGQVLGRAWPREAAAIREALQRCRVVDERPEPDDLAAYGLAEGERVAVVAAGSRFVTGRSGIDRGFALHDGRLLVLDRDLGAWLARPPAALRAPDLGLGEVVAVTGAASDQASWQLAQDGGHWLLTVDGQAVSADGELVTTWLDDLAAAAVIGFASPAADRLARARLEVTNRAGQRIDLVDRGPAAGGGRLVERRQQLAEGELVEWLILDLDAAWLAPAPRALRDQRLVPLARAALTRLELGDLRLRRDARGWSVDGERDVDLAAIEALVDAVLALRDDRPREAGSPPLVAATAERRIEHPRTDARVAALVVPPYRLRDRYLLPDLEPAAVTGLIVQPRGGAPDIFDREPDGAWPATASREIEALLATLTDLRVAEWDAELNEVDLAEDDFVSTLTLATDAATYRLRIAEDGRVAVLHRGLLGRLDGPSRRALGL